jgi:hypothetical protein
MTREQTVWVHQASFTYRFDVPEKPLETLWSARKGWGYLRGKDIWVQKQCSLEELHKLGYEPFKPLGDPSVKVCARCGAYMCDIPGSLVSKHIAQCRGIGEDWLAIEEAITHDIRVRQYEAKIMAARLREQQELEEGEKRERFDRFRDDAQSRQLAKDRKKRLKKETKEELRNR